MSDKDHLPKFSQRKIKRQIRTGALCGKPALTWRFTGGRYWV
jgi:hypothetical protein